MSNPVVPPLPYQGAPPAPLPAVDPNVMAALQSLLGSAANQPVRPANEAYADQVFALTGRRPNLPTGPKEVTFVECLSPTGAKFRAEIQPSSEFPEGRVVALRDYTMPDDAQDKCPASLEGVDRSHWFWMTYTQRDSIDFVGKPLPPGVAVEERQRAAKAAEIAATELAAKDARIAELEAQLAAAGGDAPKKHRG